jgi:pimeloyl-ACP methyl ester carboxylesterase
MQFRLAAGDGICPPANVGKVVTMHGSIDDAKTDDANGRRRLVDIGGRRLAAMSAGSGTPTVILETGLGAESAEWAAVQNDVAAFTQVLRYDRTGRGASDPVLAPGPRTADEMLDDLGALLECSQIEPPYVLVGHSFGGLLMRLFAHRHPGDVAGLVLVDSMHVDQFDVFGPMLPPPAAAEPVELTRFRQFWQGGWRDPAATPEGIDFVGTIAQARALTSLGNIPLHVIIAGTFLNQSMIPENPRAALQARWQALQMEFLKLSPRATHSLALNSGHFVQRDTPNAVSDAIKAMLSAVRAEAGGHAAAR